MIFSNCKIEHNYSNEDHAGIRQQDNEEDAKYRKEENETSGKN